MRTLQDRINKHQAKHSKNPVNRARRKKMVKVRKERLRILTLCRLLEPYNAEQLKDYQKYL